MTASLQCPRQIQEATMEVQRQHQTHWREDGTCSYCGSISPDRFLDAAAAGAKLVPTDKNYKVYIDLLEEHPDQLRWSGGSNGQDAPGRGWKRPFELTSEERAACEGDRVDLATYTWVYIKPRGPIRHAKFYFQHLDEAGKRRFIELLNNKALNVDTPGHFYVLPFFCVRAPMPEAV